MPRTIVVGTHGSAAAHQALVRAAAIAATKEYQLVIVSAYQPVSNNRLAEELRQAPFEIHWQIGPDEDVAGLLEEAASVARAKGAGCVRTSALRTRPARAILDTAERWDARQIVLGQGAARPSSIIKRVCRRARCEVTVVGGHLVPTLTYRPTGITPITA